MQGPETVNEMPNLFELVEASPLDSSEIIAIDLGTVFDGGGDGGADAIPDRIEPSVCADGPTVSVCEDGLEVPACSDGPVLSACADGTEDFSDVRLKTDIEQVGTTVYGLPLYHFRYKTGPERFEGVMAQDVLEVMPDAVVTGEDGHYRVKYARLGIRMTAI